MSEGQGKTISENCTLYECNLISAARLFGNGAPLLPAIVTTPSTVLLGPVSLPGPTRPHEATVRDNPRFLIYLKSNNFGPGTARDDAIRKIFKSRADLGRSIPF